MKDSENSVKKDIYEQMNQLEDIMEKDSLENEKMTNSSFEDNNHDQFDLSAELKKKFKRLQ